MSSVDKLQIRGIRSFSPNKDETIEFYSPLTMIVGANGCGKTTIIECLKMACTGNLPPTCSQGQSFVNDPGMTNTTEVKAHIKLRFNNQAGYPTVVARSFQVTKKKSQIQFKSLDGTIRLTDSEGRRESISQKCADLDKQMPELLGIASPILDNVVFCHQEESAWPLQDGATLKKKFDDIFDSTRYTKALESITKTKKDLQNKGKDLKADVAELGAHLQTSNMIKKELKSFETKVQSCQEEIDTLQEKESGIQDKIIQINKDIQIVEQEEKKLIELRRQVSDLDRRATEKEDSLEKVYTESDGILKTLVDDFDNVTNSRVIERNQLKQTEKSFQQSIKDKRDRLGILQSRRGEAFALQQDLELKKQEELTLMQKMAENFELNLPIIPSNETFSQRSQRVESFLRQVDTKINILNQDGENKLTKALQELDIVQKKTKQAQLNLQQLNLEIANDDKELNRIDKERQLIRSELNNYDTLSQRNARPQAESDVKQATEELEIFNSTLSIKRNQINDERRKIDDEIRELTDSITNDNRLLQDLSFYRAENERIEAQLRHSEQDILNCESDANIIEMKYHHIIDKYGDNISSNIKKLTNIKDLELIIKYLNSDAIQTQKIQTKSILENAEGTRKEIAMIQATVEMDRRRKIILQSELEQLHQAERILIECMSELNSIRFTDNNEEMYPELNDIEDFNLLLETCSAAERATAETCMALDSSKLWRDRISKKSRQKIPEGRNFVRRCPCCDKGMTNEESLKFDNNIDDLFKSNLATDELISRANEMYTRVKDISAKISSAVSIARGFNAQRTELNQINIRLSSIEDRIEILRHQEKYQLDEIEQNRKNELELEKCILELSTLYSQWFSSSQKLEEIKIKKIRQLNLVTPGGDLGGRSISNIEESLRNRNEDKQNLQTKRSRLEEDFNRLERQSLALISNLSDKKQILMEINHRMTKASELEEKLREFETNERLTISNKSTKMREKSNQERNMIKIESEEKLERDNYKKLEDLIRENSNNYQNSRNRLVTASKAHLTIAKRCEEVNLDNIDKELNSMKNEIISIERSISDLQPKIIDLDNQINQQERTKKIIMDNILARNLRQEATELFTKLHEIESKIANDNGHHHNNSMNLTELNRQLQRYTQNKQTLEKERHSLIGRMNTLVEQIDIQAKKLNTPVYKNIDDRFRKKNIEYETTLLAVSDLECYYQALDTALQKFHTLRVDEINKSIKELWQLAYRGGDIDTIEIVSGDEGASGRALKSYNYRVVMRKGDIPLDMRGRCSAGQRVLASIVIRLALAEAFCVSCGILALDEPTTNLDEAHKSGLAHALSRIISNRSLQQNFQLIIITHDEEFVKLMNMELSTMTDFAPPESYFRISRQEEGMSGKFFSHIEKIPWDEM